MTAEACQLKDAVLDHDLSRAEVKYTGTIQWLSVDDIAINNIRNNGYSGSLTFLAKQSVPQWILNWP